MYPVIKQKRRQESWKYLKIWSLPMWTEALRKVLADMLLAV